VPEGPEANQSVTPGVCVCDSVCVPVCVCVTVCVCVPHMRRACRCFKKANYQISIQQVEDVQL